MSTEANRLSRGTRLEACNGKRLLRLTSICQFTSADWFAGSAPQSVPAPFLKGAMKTLATIEEIRTEIQRRINRSAWANGYCAGCTAPVPWRIPYDGIANWMAHAGAAERPGCEGFILEVIAAVRQDYDLPPQPLNVAIARLLSSRKSSF